MTVRTVVFCGLAALAAGCAGPRGLRVENESLVFDDPFGLEIGNTDYAREFRDRIRSSRHVNVDPKTKVATTNDYDFADATLTSPYFGNCSCSLSFKGDPLALESYHLHSAGGDGGCSLEDCRRGFREIVADSERRLGIRFDVSDRTDRAEEELEDCIRRCKADGGKFYGCATSVLSAFATRNLDGVAVNYSICGMYSDKRKCSIDVSVSRARPPRYSGRSVSVTSNEVGSAGFPGFGLAATETQRKAHAEAKDLREALKRLFAVDLDASSVTNDFGAFSTMTNLGSRTEWEALSSPVAGLTERKVGRSVMLGPIPFTTFSVRRPFAGDVDERELKAAAAAVRAAIEKEYGRPLAEVDQDTETVRRSAEWLGEGVPTFGDTRAQMGLDKTTSFLGHVGDLALDISYAGPRYVRRDGELVIAVRGAVIVNVVQSPILPGNVKTKSN